MNTAIKILEEMIGKLYENKKDCNSCYDNGLKLCEFHGGQEWALENAIERISSLPPLDIDSLQRYDCELSGDCPYMDENDNGEYVRYESLVDLLRN